VSSANLDLVRSIFADWERGGFSEDWWAHPEIEFVFADGPSPGSRTGLAGMRKGVRDSASPWEALRVVAEGYRDLDGERVLVLGHSTGRGKASGVELGGMRTGERSCSTSAAAR
jgi:hypothetical protein